MLLTNRILDVGAIIVAITSVIVTTKNTVRVMKDNLDKLTSIIEKHQVALYKHDTEIATIHERCKLLNSRGEGCSEEG